LKKNILPSNFEKILWSNKFLKVPPCRNDFYEKQDGICFLWDLGLWILTIQPSHSYTLAYCKPIQLISIEFQNKNNNQGSLPKKTFSSPSIVIILQSIWSLWLRFFLQIVSIVRYKILRLEIEKHHFIFIIGPHVNKYMVQHVSGPIFSKTALKF
jgi:hypothetical protein